MFSAQLNISMDKHKSYLETLKEAMAKKQAIEHPDAKTQQTKGKKPQVNAGPKGPPVRRGASRGG